MSTAASSAATGASAAAAIANAVKASGVLVKMEPEEWRALLDRADRPLVVHAEGGFFSTNHQYLTSYKGLAFHTKTSEPLTLPVGADVVEAKKIGIPG
jgi:ABC-type branched-subunit amino acid transport system substrate-binding protein